MLINGGYKKEKIYMIFVQQLYIYFKGQAQY